MSLSIKIALEEQDHENMEDNAGIAAVYDFGDLQCRDG